MIDAACVSAYLALSTAAEHTKRIGASQSCANRHLERPMSALSPPKAVLVTLLPTTGVGPIFLNAGSPSKACTAYARFLASQPSTNETVSSTELDCLPWLAANA